MTCSWCYGLIPRERNVHTFVLHLDTNEDKETSITLDPVCWLKLLNSLICADAVRAYAQILTHFSENSSRCSSQSHDRQAFALASTRPADHKACLALFFYLPTTTYAAMNSRSSEGSTSSLLLSLILSQALMWGEMFPSWSVCSGGGWQAHRIRPQAGIWDT